MTDKKDNNDNARIFEFEDKKYKIIRPTNKIRRESEAVYAKAYRRAIHDGFFLDAEIEEILRTRNMDDKGLRDKKNNLTGQMKTIELTLKNKDYKNKKEGRRLALDLKDLR